MPVLKTLRAPSPAAVRAARESIGATQEGAAASLGVSTRAVQLWEAEDREGSGRTPPPYLALAFVALGAPHTIFEEDPDVP